MKLPSKIKFRDRKTRKAFDALLTKHADQKKLYSWLTRAFKDIEEDAFCGTQIPRQLIPKSYAKKHKIKNIWKYNLPNAWRLLYSVENNRILIVSIVLDWMDHKNYEKRFNY